MEVKINIIYNERLSERTVLRSPCSNSSQKYLKTIAILQNMQNHSVGDTVKRLLKCIKFAYHSETVKAHEEYREVRLGMIRKPEFIRVTTKTFFFDLLLIKIYGIVDTNIFF